MMAAFRPLSLLARLLAPAPAPRQKVVFVDAAWLEARENGGRGAQTLLLPGDLPLADLAARAQAHLGADRILQHVVVHAGLIANDGTIDF